MKNRKIEIKTTVTDSTGFTTTGASSFEIYEDGESRSLFVEVTDFCNKLSAILHGISSVIGMSRLNEKTSTQSADEVVN